MRLSALFITGLAAAIGPCHREPIAVQAGPSGWTEAVPLTDTQVAELHVADALIALLPYGRGTPVLPIQDEHGLRGFSFSVTPERARFIIHALRRQLALTDLSPAPFVYGVPGPEEAHDTGIAILLKDPSEAAALHLATPAERQEGVAAVNAFLDEWAGSADLSLLAVDPDSAWLEVDQVPDGQEGEQFLSALVEHMPGAEAETTREQIANREPIQISLK